jgi:DNA (cytosine-5)-methyltransferase 1
LLAKYPTEATNAAKEAWCAELGGKNAPEELVDRRIKEALGNAAKWVLIGGPPCQAYSLVGRSRVIGDGTGRDKYDSDPRHHLYLHYLRILAVHRPPVFVMENVKGLLSAKVKKASIFDQILGDLKNPLNAIPKARRNDNDSLNYRLMPLVESTGEVVGVFEPEDFIIRAEKFGIPQARHRLIILGIRSDIEGQPELLEPADEVSVKAAIGDLPRLRSGLSKENDTAESWLEAIRKITSSRWFNSTKTSIGLQLAILTAVQNIRKNLGRGSPYIKGSKKAKCHADWYSDAKLDGVINHETRGHNKDTELRLILMFKAHGITGWRRKAAVFGKPDFVFPKQKLAVFVDGCFWHGCPIHAIRPKSNTKFWDAKITRNQARDGLVNRTLRNQRWRVLRVWEHELAKKNTRRLAARLRRVGLLPTLAR